MGYDDFMEKAVDMVITVYNELYSDGYLLISDDVWCSYVFNDSTLKRGVFYTTLDNELLYEVTYNSSDDCLFLNVFRKLIYREYSL